MYNIIYNNYSNNKFIFIYVMFWTGKSYESKHRMLKKWSNIDVNLLVETFIKLNCVKNKLTFFFFPVLSEIYVQKHLWCNKKGKSNAHVTGRQDYFDEKDNCLKQCWDSKKKKKLRRYGWKKMRGGTEINIQRRARWILNKLIFQFIFLTVLLTFL